MKEFEVTFKVRGYNHSRHVIKAQDRTAAEAIAIVKVGGIFEKFELVGVRELS